MRDTDGQNGQDAPSSARLHITHAFTQKECRESNLYWAIFENVNIIHFVVLLSQIPVFFTSFAHVQIQNCTGATRNFDWEGPKRENLVKLVWWRFWCRNNDDVTEMTSQLFLKVRVCHNNPFEKSKFGQITQLQVTKIES